LADDSNLKEKLAKYAPPRHYFLYSCAATSKCIIGLCHFFFPVKYSPILAVNLP
jgi:hypothetical protein